MEVKVKLTAKMRPDDTTLPTTVYFDCVQGVTIIGGFSLIVPTAEADQLDIGGFYDFQLVTNSAAAAPAAPSTTAANPNGDAPATPQEAPAAEEAAAEPETTAEPETPPEAQPEAPTETTQETPPLDDATPPAPAPTPDAPAEPLTQNGAANPNGDQA